MSRLPAIDLDDRRDDVKLRGESERPCRDDFEPADFDDVRIAERFGPQPDFFDFGPDFDQEPF